MKKYIYILKLYLLLILFIIFNCTQNKKINIEMVYVESGKFMMGDDSGAENEKPVHEVKITKSFYISKYEITFKQFDAFCEDVKKNKPNDRGWGRDNLPVIHVNWYEALAFCNWLSKTEGLKPCYYKKNNKWVFDVNANGYRLPTEAEWEYTARGGKHSKGYIYSGSNNPDEIAWYSNNADNHPHPVGQKKPNELGLYDMSGNVWEWCWDGHDDDFYKTSPVTDPIGKSAWFQEKRGGSWKGSIAGLKVSFRNSDYPAPDITNDVGFRIIKNIE